jgi:hypothetical protein
MQVLSVNNFSHYHTGKISLPIPRFEKLVRLTLEIKGRGMSGRY